MKLIGTHCCTRVVIPKEHQPFELKNIDSMDICYLQVMIGAPYGVYAADEEKVELLKADLKSSIAQICSLSHQNIEDVHLEVGMYCHRNTNVKIL